MTGFFLSETDLFLSRTKLQENGIAEFLKPITDKAHIITPALHGDVV